MTSFISRGLTRMFSTHLKQRQLSSLAKKVQSSSVLPKSQFSLMPSTMHNSNIIIRNISSQVDTEFLSLLKDELNAEKEHMYAIPTFSRAWKIDRRGPDCKLTKQIDNERIEVTFNVNQSVPPLISENVDETDEVRAEPDFNVDIKKGSQVLSVECFFPDEDEEGEYNDDGYTDNESNFSIRHLTLHDGEINVYDYVMETENLDKDLYSYFLKYLGARGIDNMFSDELVQYATAVENNCYIRALEGIESFIKK